MVYMRLLIGFFLLGLYLGILSNFMVAFYGFFWLSHIIGLVGLTLIILHIYKAK